MIEQADVETASKLHDIAFATTDQNAQRQKLIIEDEIDYEKIKTDTLIEQTQRNLDHDDEIVEIENARLKPRTDNKAEVARLKDRTDNEPEAARLKALQDAERIKHKADIADNLKLKFAKRKREKESHRN